MKELRLKSQQFRAEREADWRRLEGLLARVEGRSPRSLTDEELLALPVLYRAALSSLSVARATSLDHSLVDYLESLSARAYFVVYGPRASIRERLARFFTDSWPGAVRSLWRETLVSALIFWLAVAVGYLLVDRDHSWYASLIGQGMAEGRDFTATTAQLRATIYQDPHVIAQHDLSQLASFLFTHNAQVSLMAFALGFAFGAPTVFLVAQNALGLGAMLDLFQARGLGLPFAAWLAIHGTTELFSLILSGAAGLKMGWNLAFPGARTRLEAAKAAGVVGARVMTGVVVMLAVAGMLEGFGRQLIQNDIARISIGATALVLWLAYFYLPRSARRPA